MVISSSIRFWYVSTLDRDLQSFATAVSSVRPLAEKSDKFKQPLRGVLKICSKFTGEHPCRSVISISMEASDKLIPNSKSCSINAMKHFSSNQSLQRRI